MKNRQIEFFCKVKGDFSPAGLQKVFFSFVDGDREWLPVIAEDIWNIADCAIYYHEDNSIDDADIDDYEKKLSEMILFVVFITTKVLTSDNLVKDKEFGFAVDNHIPILPIAIENGLEELFSEVMNAICPGYGNIQLLKYHVTDSTELSFQHKFMRDVKSVLADDTEVEKIKSAFLSSIFLSYRKKDRNYANQLMRIIHSIPSLQRVAIWYDEYISTGEKWSNQIQDALEKSDVFLLMVTPALTEPDNYVIRVEYPAAKEKDKKIVPVLKANQQFTAETRSELSRIFPDLKILVDGDNAAALEKALNDISDNNYSSPETDYLVGLAFFNGINVEKDTERAVSLIFASAEKGLPEAINKLADMYRNGDGLERNYEQSIEYRKELVNLYERRCAGEKCELKDLLGYIDALKQISEDQYDLGIIREAYYFSSKLMDAVDLLKYSDSSEEVRNLYASACDIFGKISLRLGKSDQARDSYRKYCDCCRESYEKLPTDSNYHDLSVGYERLGNVEYANANLSDAAAWFEKARIIRNELYIKLGNADTAQSLSCICLFTGDVYIRENHVHEAEDMYENALILRRQLYSARSTLFSSVCYGEALISRSTTALLLRDYDNAKLLLKEAERIFSELANEYGTIETWRNYAIVLNREGNLYIQQDMEREALTCYQESLAIRNSLLQKYRSNSAVYDCAITLYFIAQCYEKVSQKTEQMAALEEAIELLLPILSADQKTDWHRIFTEASYNRFMLDTFTGKKYLQYAIQGWDWLSQRKPEVTAYKKGLEQCKKMYQRCYPE